MAGKCPMQHDRFCCPATLVQACKDFCHVKELLLHQSKPLKWFVSTAVDTAQESTERSLLVTCHGVNLYQVLMLLRVALQLRVGRKKLPRSVGSCHQLPALGWHLCSTAV